MSGGGNQRDSRLFSWAYSAMSQCMGNMGVCLQPRIETIGCLHRGDSKQQVLKHANNSDNGDSTIVEGVHREGIDKKSRISLDPAPIDERRDEKKGLLEIL